MRQDCVCVIANNCVLPFIPMQHKKLSVEGGGSIRDLRKGQKQGDLEIWDPVDQVLSEDMNGHLLLH